MKYIYYPSLIIILISLIFLGNYNYEKAQAQEKEMYTLSASGTKIYVITPTIQTLDKAQGEIAELKNLLSKYAKLYDSCRFK